LYDNPLTALGSPDDLSGETGLNPFNFIFPNVLSPFSPPFEGDEIVEIGPGGQLTLRLSNFVLVGPGYDLGVFANVGLSGEFDQQTFELLGATDPAAAFGAESAVVEVSQDGQAWVALNGGTEILFDMPANYYQNAGAFDGAPPAGPVLADFGQPIAPDLSVFDGESEAGVLAALGGSAGGYWLDLSATGFAKVGYVRFSVPLGLLPDEPYSASLLDTVVFELDAVSIANGKVGGRVPEPGSLMILVALGLGGWKIATRRPHWRGPIAN
jgi:hypothetical protein